MKNDSVGIAVLVAIVAVCGYVWWTTSNFALALVLIIAAFFVVWLVDRVAFARRRTERAVADGNQPHEPVLVDYARSFFPVLLAVLLLRTFVVEPFRIPSGSMMPTLLVGDFVLVNKFAYGLRLPVLNTKILSTGEPKRGDIAVFRYPGYTCKWTDGKEVRGGDPACMSPVQKEDYIKRIVGLPGDAVVVHAENITINGKPVPQQLIGAYRGTDKVSIRMEESLAFAPVTTYREQLDAVTHQTLHFGRPESPVDQGQPQCPNGTLLPDGGCEWVVPKGYYFAMGDNRDDSADSRYWGFVPEQNLAGRAFFIWFSIADWPHGLRRIGTVLH